MSKPSKAKKPAKPAKRKPGPKPATRSTEGRDEYMTRAEREARKGLGDDQLAMMVPLLDAAKHFGLEPETLRRWVASGKVPVLTHQGGAQSFVFTREAVAKLDAAIAAEKA